LRSPAVIAIVGALAITASACDGGSDANDKSGTAVIATTTSTVAVASSPTVEVPGTAAPTASAPSAGPAATAAPPTSGAPVTEPSVAPTRPASDVGDPQV
jgi:hypothetical protein